MDAVIVLGTAGSGKTTFTAKYSEWLKERFSPFKSRTINLDPGALNLPYDPDFDVREIISVNELMEKEGLGPNGALVRAAEIMVSKVDEIVRMICSLPCDHLVIDTPGQMEIFAFRPLGRVLCEHLSSCLNLAAVFLGDHEPGRELEDVVSSAMLAKILELKLGVTVIPLLNKVDLWKGEPVDEIWEMVLRGELDSMRGGKEGVLSDALMELISALSSFRSSVRVTAISAKEGIGFQEVFDLLNEVWCSCGDMT